MKLNILSAKLIKQITAERKRGTLSINNTHPDTKGWKLELTPDGLLCTMRSGELKLIPFTNVIELEVEEAKAPKSAMKTK